MIKFRWGCTHIYTQNTTTNTDNLIDVCYFNVAFVYIQLFGTILQNGGWSERGEITNQFYLYLVLDFFAPAPLPSAYVAQAQSILIECIIRLYNYLNINKSIQTTSRWINATNSELSNLKREREQH